MTINQFGVELAKRLGKKVVEAKERRKEKRTELKEEARMNPGQHLTVLATTLIWLKCSSATLFRKIPTFTGTTLPTWRRPKDSLRKQWSFQCGCLTSSKASEGRGAVFSWSAHRARAKLCS